MIYKKASNTISPDVIADNMNDILGDFMFEVTEYDEFSGDYGAPERIQLEEEFIENNRLSRKVLIYLLQFWIQIRHLLIQHQEIKR